MKRWNKVVCDFIEDLKIDAFLKDIEVVCRKHGLSISHEDNHGSFSIEVFSEDNIEWLMGGDDNT